MKNALELFLAAMYYHMFEVVTTINSMLNRPRRTGMETVYVRKCISSCKYEEECIQYVVQFKECRGETCHQYRQIVMYM